MQKKDAENLLGVVTSPNFTRRSNSTAFLGLIPTGAYVFQYFDTDISGNNASLKYTLISGLQASGFQKLSVPVSDAVKRSVLINAIHDAFLKTVLNIYPNSPQLHLINAEVRTMPYNLQTSFDIATILSTVMFPFALSFLLPVFVYHLVMEKQGRLREFMKIMGMKTSLYWCITFFFDYVLYLGVIVIFITGGLIWELRFFMTISSIVYILLFVLWGFALIALSFFVSAFFNKTRPATVVSYLLVLLSTIAGNVMNRECKTKI